MGLTRKNEALMQWSGKNNQKYHEEYWTMTITVSGLRQETQAKFKQLKFARDIGSVSCEGKINGCRKKSSVGGKKKNKNTGHQLPENPLMS